MTAPDENTIDFIRLRAETLPMEVEVCGRCYAVILPMHRQDHANWHASMTRGVKIAGLGFGSMGMGAL